MKRCEQRTTGAGAEIARRAEASGAWVYVADLPRGQGPGAWTSRHRSLRRLADRGFIEKRTDKHNRVCVRLTPGVQLSSLGDVKRLDEPGRELYNQERSGARRRFAVRAGGEFELVFHAALPGSTEERRVLSDIRRRKTD